METSAPANQSSLDIPLGSLIFLSRWLQAPLYLGLIVAQGVYVYHFFVELWHLVSGVAEWAKTFIALGTENNPDYRAVMWQVIVHLTFVASALLLAWTDRVSTQTATEVRAEH
ncbi:MAG TPA: YqhA family protein [Chthoniobacterales bacterium]